jgi:hypothetical protein
LTAMLLGRENPRIARMEVLPAAGGRVVVSL